jgi:predicted ATPase
LEAQGDGDEAEAAASRTLAVPPSLQASLMARLDRLGPAKEVAQIAAAIGRQSRHALLALVARMTESDLEAPLERLERAGLLFRQGRPPEATYRFKHALLQDLAYGALLRERKRALHARIAEALEASFPEVGETEPELLARHCAEAGLTAKAAALWGKAGPRSLKRSALGEAESQFPRALAVIAAQPGAPALRREEIACQIGLASTLLLSRGYASAARAALSRTLALIERADALGEPVDDPLVFTTLRGLWTASIVASSGEATRRSPSNVWRKPMRRRRFAPLANSDTPSRSATT